MGTDKRPIAMTEMSLSDFKQYLSTICVQIDGSNLAGVETKKITLGEIFTSTEVQDSNTNSHKLVTEQALIATKAKTDKYGVTRLANSTERSNLSPGVALEPSGLSDCISALINGESIDINMSNYPDYLTVSSSPAIVELDAKITKVGSIHLLQGRIGLAYSGSTTIISVNFKNMNLVYNDIAASVFVDNEATNEAVACSGKVTATDGIYNKLVVKTYSSVQLCSLYFTIPFIG